MTLLASLVLSDARTLFSLVSQSELVTLKGLAALCVAPESFIILAETFPLILTFLYSFLHVTPFILPLITPKILP